MIGVIKIRLLARTTKLQKWNVANFTDICTDKLRFAPEQAAKIKETRNVL